MRRAELELLAPARDADIGIAAIDHGADAVYIGGPSFGARDKAGNSVADIARLAAHAHRYHARVFVTVNTILRDDELEGARQLVWQLHEAGADALIVQDMGLTMLDLPPIQLHASTQTDIRTPEKARFLQDAGFAQMVLARELTLQQIEAVAQQVDRAVLEFFIHGALCVAYSGQCFISHAHTGRSANRGNCSQECRLPYTVLDAQGRIVAHDKHVLSLKDNNQSANLAALVRAGIRSFKIEGRYKDLSYVKNVTAHYRQQLDALMTQGWGSDQSDPSDQSDHPDGAGLAGRTSLAGLRPSSSGRTRHFFTPDPDRNFNRGSTDYFVHGRKDDIGAFDTPKHAGLPVGEVIRIGRQDFELRASDAVTFNNGDALTWWDLQGELQGVPVNVAEAIGTGRWRIEPNAEIASLKDLRVGTAISRNRDMAWERMLAKPSSERRIGVTLHWQAVPDGFALTLTDTDGHVAYASQTQRHEPARDAVRAKEALHAQLTRLGGTEFEADQVIIEASAAGLFVPASLANVLRREAVAALQTARATAFQRLAPLPPVEPPVAYPEDTLSYLANVYNRQAAAFYARHGVTLIDSAYESQETLGEVSLMITRHCVRASLSLCPKQAKGVTGVQGTVRAEPMTLRHGNDTLTLRFDCKPCEMHVVGAMRPNVLRDSRRERALAQAEGSPMVFYRSVSRQSAG
jgi:collagenase-like PrtC family protease